MADAGRGADLFGHGHAIGFVPADPAFRKDKRPFADWDPGQCLPDDFLGVSEAVYGGCIDPIDSAMNRMADRGNGYGIVLPSPTCNPAGAANGPCAEADAGNVHIGETEAL